MLILIAEDESGVRESLKEFLMEEHEVLSAPDGAQALEVLKKTAVDVLITDHQMPKLSGLELIRKGREISPGTSFMLMTAFGSIDQAVEAIRLGADDYFMKPFEFPEIAHRIRRIEDLRSWKAENTAKDEAGRGAARLIGKSQGVARAKEFISKVATVNSPVLLLGPSGSGKEILAKAIHESGPRSSRPFIAINCASLNEQLMESELFGHEKGAFTGATASKPGKFELAKGGTLFLDEVGELSPPIQAKFLRVLQEKEFFRVGGVRQIKSDARVIAATHRRLKEMVKEGSFREDLFFRLNVLMFELPPLCERPEDIPVLTEYIWRKLTRELCRKVALSDQAMEVLVGYSYPGNVRELQNVLERLIVLGPENGVVGAEHFPPEFRSKPEFTVVGVSLKPCGLTEQIEEIERKLVLQAMSECNGNQVKAAELLKITRGALQYKLKKYGAPSGDGSREGPNRQDHKQGGDGGQSGSIPEAA